VLIISRKQIFKHTRRATVAKPTKIIDPNKRAYVRKGKYPNDYMAELYQQQEEDYDLA
jgi:hypothetical protein